MQYAKCLCLLLVCTGDENNDIDVYTDRLESILSRKLALIRGLQSKLATFKKHLQEEEQVSKSIADRGAKR